MMLHAAEALKLAVDLMHLPSQVRLVRSAPLPADVRVLLCIAAGDEEVTSQAAESAGRSRDVVREAAAFFIEQIMLYPGADSYRVLGATPEAPSRELRRNMALLLRWLHPDSDREDQRVVFSTRVTRAWNDLKTKERRAAYDRLRRISMANTSGMQRKHGARAPLNRRGPNQPWNYGPPHGGGTIPRRSPHLYSGARRGVLHRILLLLFGRSTL